MQTFLPYSDFKRSAEALDRQRLGKQRLEAKWVINALAGKYTKKQVHMNHPLLRMWKGYDNAIKLYYNTVIDEWRKRGYKSNMRKYNIKGEVTMPPWLRSRNFINSHRSNLLRKNAPYYSQFKWNVEPGLPYVWPVKKEEM